MNSGESWAEENGEGFRFSPRPNRAGDVQWRNWTAGAFEEAEEQGKLVLLSISAVWCHWCHVMDETTYSDPDVIERINRDYVPVRVDSDKRPDINRRYNQGGWPTTAFLVPSGRAVAGLTYAPPQQLAALLDELSALYRHRKNDIDTEAAAAAAQERESIRGTRAKGGIDPRTALDVEAAILEAWDRGYGGLGEAPKFPTAGALEFALARYSETRDAAMKSFVVSTLDGMSLGEINDRVEGGFFRYATARDWSTPHYEKMLSDNAELAYLYLAASQVLDRPDYAHVARGALDYAIRNLLDDEQRGFFGSQDADEKYYHRDAGGRAALEAPAVDRTIYTDSTSLMVSALVLGSYVLDDPGLLAIAERVSDFIWREGCKHGSGLCHYYDIQKSAPVLWGQPADQVNYLRALVDLCPATSKPRFLERAVELGRMLVTEFIAERGWIGEAEAVVSDAGQAVLDDVPADLPDIVVNGNGARALLALEALAPGHGFGDAAARILESLAGKYKAYTYFASGYALAAMLLDEGLIEVRVAHSGPERARKEINAAAAAAFNPRKLVRLETVEDYLPVDEDETPPPAVVCSVGQCQPVYSAGELKDVLESLTVGGGSNAGDGA